MRERARILARAGIPLPARRRGAGPAAAVRIVRARPGDAAELTMIAHAAKGHWGYPESWLRRWEGELTVTGESIRRHPTYVAAQGGRAVGFYMLLVETAEASLNHLWVVPPAMGKGVGRALFQHAEGVARRAHVSRLRVVSDPHAEEFYVRMGAAVYGREPAFMDGHERFLPLLEKVL
jgi:GNAT superfamily N-acetyltransferase